MTDELIEEAEAWVKWSNKSHQTYMTSKGRNPDDYLSEFTRLRAIIRALTTALTEAQEERDRLREALEAVVDFYEDWGWVNGQPTPLPDEKQESCIVRARAALAKEQDDDK
ncbi:MAG: hypothetical protein CML68_13725 [Rhodobacteraceae bacterium]|nr:hypothetical protein [Paracoccaceae bacterium]